MEITIIAKCENCGKNTISEVDNKGRWIYDAWGLKYNRYIDKDLCEDCFQKAEELQQKHKKERSDKL
jgi:hypothetical protein